jgi:hypothetical protein
VKAKKEVKVKKAKEEVKVEEVVKKTRKTTKKVDKK